MRVTTSRVDISPEYQVDLGASNAGSLPWSGTLDPLEANMIAIWPASETPVLLISADCLYIGSYLRHVVEKASNLPASNIVMFASHTHRAPMLDDSKPLLGRVDDAHLQSISMKISRAVQRVLGGPSAETTMSSASSLARHSMNRRLRKRFVLSKRPSINKFVNAPNATGATDENLVTATLRDADHKAVAAIVNYGCHPVGAPRINGASSHYIGVVRNRIRDAENNAYLPVIFIQGFSGNTRPNASAGAWTFRRRLRQLVSGPLFEDMSMQVYKSWTASLADVVQLTRESEATVTFNTVSARRIEREGLFKPADFPATFSRIDLGEDFSIVGMSGELVSEYGPRLRRMVQKPFVCSAGCLDITFGYVPTLQIVREGGYEGGGYIKQFGIDWVSPEVECVVLEAFEELSLQNPVGR